MASNSEVALEKLISKMMAEGLGDKLRDYRYIIIYAMNILADDTTSDMTYMKTLSDILYIYDRVGLPNDKMRFYKETIEYAKNAVLKDKKLDDENMVRSMVYILEEYGDLPPELKEWLEIAKKRY